MKRLLIAVLALGVFALVAANAQAEEKYVAGGFEMAGHIMTGAGYQHYTKNPVNADYHTFDGDYTYGYGVLGKYISKPENARANMFSFFVDGVELDIMKSFGENIRLRADLDFARVNSGGSQYGNPAFVMEQAYATANIPIGNGIEFLLGRFNTPIGFEAADASENDTISKSSVATGLRPTNTTGVKFYYSFSDLVDLHVYAVNTLTADNTINMTPGIVANPTGEKFNSLPSAGFRLGFNWGDEGTESTVGVSGLFGPETGSSNHNFTYAGDIDLNWWITDSFAIGAEAIYRVDNNLTWAPLGAAVGTGKNTNIGGVLNLHYVFSDVWDGTLKYAFAKVYQPTNGVYNLLSNTGRITAQQASLAGGYAIADGAKLKLEGRMDMVKPLSAATGTQYVYGGAVAFVYDF